MQMRRPEDGFVDAGELIAHDFAVLPKSVHSTSAISIAEEFAELPKSIHIVPVRSEAPPAKQAIGPPAPSGAARTSRCRFGRFRNIALAR